MCEDVRVVRMCEGVCEDVWVYVGVHCTYMRVSHCMCEGMHCMCEGVHCMCDGVYCI